MRTQLAPTWHVLQVGETSTISLGTSGCALNSVRSSATLLSVFTGGVAGFADRWLPPQPAASPIIASTAALEDGFVPLLK